MEAINIEFVGEIEQHPVLYNYTHPSYSRKDLTEKTWMEIGKKFTLTGQECKEKWRNLRNSYVKNLKPPSSGSSAKRRKEYYLAKAMQFALPFIKVPGLISENVVDVKNEDMIVVPFDSMDEVISGDQQTSSNSFDDNKRKMASNCDCDVSAYFKAKTDYYKEQSVGGVTFEESDALKMFLLSLIPDLKSLPPNKVRIFKRRTLSLIDDLINDEES